MEGMAYGMEVSALMMGLQCIEVNEWSWAFRCAKHWLCNQSDSGKTGTMHFYGTEKLI